MEDERNLSRQAMEQAVISVVAAMTGMSAEVIEARDIPPFEIPLINARIAYSGPYSGDLGLMIEQPLAELIGMHMLGFGPGEHLIQDMIDDAVKELLNVVCGRFLTLMFGSKPVFSLNIPQAFPLGAQVCNALVQNSPLLAFRVEGYTIIGNVRMKKSGE